MNITELIKACEDFKSKHGVLNVYVFEEGHGYSSPNLFLIIGDLNNTLDGLFPEIDIFKKDKQALLFTHDKWKEH